MWQDLYRRWLDVVLWWVPRQQKPPREAEAAPARKPQKARPGASQQAAAPPAAANTRAPDPGFEPAAKQAAAPPQKPVAPPVPDDLTVIKGIGPAVQNKLRALGITTFADLAAADPDRLLAQLKGSQPLTLGRVRHWTEAARQRLRS